MDGSLIATVVSSSVVVGGAIAGGFWRVMIRIGRQDESIGRLEGKVDGLTTATHIFQGQLRSFDERMGRLDERINNVVTKED